MISLHRFSDIHTHYTGAPADSLICISPYGHIRPDRFYSAGIHPWDTADEQSARNALAHLALILPSEQIAAIGECGLDALRGGPAAIQEEIFMAQARLAEQYGLPVIIHCVRRFDTLIRLHRELNPHSEWIIHGFRGKPQLARELLRHGFSLSFGHTRNEESFSITPPERRYSESDSPGL